MSTFRTKHDRSNPYVVINKSFLESPDLSAKAKGLLAYLLSRPDNWETHIKQLEKVMKDGKDAIASGLKELERNGYFVRYPVRNELGRISHWIRDVYEIPQTDNDPSDNNGDEQAITGKPGSRQTTVGQARSGFSGSGFVGSGKPGSIIYKDEITTDELINEGLNIECNNAPAPAREDTHTQSKGDPVKSSMPEKEVICDVVDGEIEQEINDPWEHKQASTNSRSQKNSIDPKDQDHAAPRDNKDSEGIKYNGLSAEKVEKLQEQFDSGEVTDLPRRDKIALALYTMPEVSHYRKSGKILSSRPNDIDPAFLRYFAFTQWNGSTDLDKARCTIIKYESSLERWNVLYSVLQRWVESKKDPEKGYQDLKASAMERFKDKRQPVSHADLAVISNGVRVTADPRQIEQRKKADRERQELLDRLKLTGS